MELHRRPNRKGATAFAVALGLFAMGAAACGGGDTSGQPDVPKSYVTGSVTTVDRSAPPEGAVIVVRVFDAQGEPTSASIIGQEEITLGGEQLPVEFEVPYDEASVNPEVAYRATADITVDGALRYLTTSKIPVLTDGAPSEGVEIVVEAVS